MITDFICEKCYLVFNIVDIAAIAETLDCKICVSREKKLILECIENESLCQRLTLMKHEARVHVVAMNQVNPTVCYIVIVIHLIGFVILHQWLYFWHEYWLTHSLCVKHLLVVTYLYIVPLVHFIRFTVLPPSVDYIDIFCHLRSQTLKSLIV